MRLIDADALMKDIAVLEEGLEDMLDEYPEANHIDSHERTKIYISIEDINVFKEMVEEAPTVERPKGEWISVEDRLPKRRMECLCLYQFGDTPEYRYYGVLFFNPEECADNGYVKGPHFNNEGMDDMKVVYWMPLPEKPDMRGEGE